MNLSFLKTKSSLTLKFLNKKKSQFIFNQRVHAVLRIPSNSEPNTDPDQLNVS